jgi:hypothetical protein
MSMRAVRFREPTFTRFFIQRCRVARRRVAFARGDSRYPFAIGVDTGE